MNRVLITGGAGGIGSAIAQRCAEDGYEPVTVDLKDADIRADLSDAGQARAAVEQALASGPITRVVNNVGMPDVAGLADLDLDQLDRVLRLNLVSAVVVTQALVAGMRAAGFGRIVNISSRAALGKEGRSAYAATKAGLLGLTRTWALELGADGITVNAVGPGPIATPMFEAANPPGAPATQQLVASIPVRRMGRPGDVAHAVSGFLDDRAGFVTGQVLYVCGGKTVGLTTL